MALRVDREDFVLVNAQKLVLIHEHVDDFRGLAQISNRFGRLNHDVAGLCVQHYVCQDANRVLVRPDLQIYLLLLFVGEHLFRNGRAVSLGLLESAGYHFLHIWFFEESLGASHANDLVMAALVDDQLVEGLESKVGLLIVLGVRLQQWHNKRPE